jgi:Trk K+ transport system NAD-binding subunit
VVSPLLAFWYRLFGRDERRRGRVRGRIPVASAVQSVFLVLRRMRAPLIVLIVIFAVCVFVLTLIPGRTADGQQWHMSVFDAFYFMSYTASTIGFGELPHEFSPGQRLWVTVSIYLTVIGWAYAIGSLLALLQDRAFRQALALQHFQRKVSRLREPFLLFAGFGRTGELLGGAFDSLGKRFVVLDLDEDRIESLELATYHGDVPALVADARDPRNLGVAGLGSAWCDGVLALTNDDEVNLAVAMAAALLRPEVPVVARTVSPTVAERMRAFGEPTVVNPFDRFGDHLRIALRAPATYQLMTWLESGPGAERPPRGRPPAQGRWVVCGYGRFGRELIEDLHAEGLGVTVVDPVADAAEDPAHDRARFVRGHGFEPGVLERAGVADAVGFVAGTDNDTTNLSLVAAARRFNDRLFVAARQNLASSAPLFAAVGVDSLLVPTEVVAHEVFAQLSTPLLWRFLRELPHRDDRFAAELVDRLSERCDRHLQALWKIRLTRAEAPALAGWLAAGGARLGDLLRDPDDRDVQLPAVVLMVLRGGQCLLAPGDDTELRPGDELLLAGRPAARRGLDTTMVVDAAREYVVTGRHVPAGWAWRWLTRAERPATLDRTGRRVP